MAEKPIELSRYCIPWTPFSKVLAESTVCLVTTAAVRTKDDVPFNKEGDATFRVIPGEVTGAQLTYDDAHFDHACADADINCIFPIDRLRELAGEKKIGAVAPEHFSMGFSQALRELRQSTLPAIAWGVDRTRPDAVLLTGG